MNPKNHSGEDNIASLRERQRNGADKQVIALRKTVDKLAQLDNAEYAVQRVPAAKKCKIKIATLDKLVAEARRRPETVYDDDIFNEPTPWDKPIVGAKLLNNIARAFNRHIALRDGEANALALWVMHCHCYEAFTITPRLRITSPVPGCGKTQLLDVVHHLTPRAIKADHITGAAMFRLLDRPKPILLVDEADTYFKDNNDLRNVVDTGHRNGGFVLRADRDNPKAVIRYRTFGPVAIAGLGKLHQTIVDRSITLDMKRRRPEDQIQDLTPAHYSRLDTLCRKAARWTADHYEELKIANPEMPEFINRVKDNWKPLLAIADLAGGDWPTRARDIAIKLSSTENKDDDVKIILLEDIKSIFDESGKPALPSTFICKRLAAVERRAWGEWRQGKPITAWQLARLLSDFRVAPGTIRMEDGTSKGYKRANFEEPWQRYLPKSLPLNGARKPSHRHKRRRL